MVRFCSLSNIISFIVTAYAIYFVFLNLQGGDIPPSIKTHESELMHLLKNKTFYVLDHISIERTHYYGLFAINDTIRSTQIHYRIELLKENMETVSRFRNLSNDIKIIYFDQPQTLYELLSIKTVIP